MDDWRRQAIYFAPPAGSPLARFGAAWLGWDPEAGAEVEDLPVAGLPLPREALVAAPRRYGFHATLKPPFRLAAGRDAAGLDEARRRGGGGAGAVRAAARARLARRLPRAGAGRGAAARWPRWRPPA